MHSFKDLLLSGSFSVPSFQRAYAWRKEHCKQFIKDLEEATASSEDEPYYYGHFLLLDEKNGDRVKIVDGQ